MPDILDSNLPVVMGNCIHVGNIEKRTDPKLKDEDDVLICIQVENEYGNEEYPILMTQDEFDNKLKKGSLVDIKIMKPGRIYPKFLWTTNYYCVKLRDNENNVFIGFFNIKDWAKYFQRALTHPKSCTKKTIFTDILD